MKIKNLFKCGWMVLMGTVLLTACKPPKYAKYASSSGDFSCEVPWGWSTVVDNSGSDYANVTFTGPMEPSFYRGVPSLSVRWHRVKAPHRLPDGSYESYAGYEDYVKQMMRDVYGPDGKMWAGEDRELALALSRQEAFPAFQRIKISEWEGYYFVVHRTLPAPKGQVLGVSQDNAGERVVLQRHAYAVLPMDGGFYVLIYPSTKDGFEKYKPAFFRLINSFRAIKDGPAGPKVDYRAAKPSSSKTPQVQSSKTR